MSYVLMAHTNGDDVIPSQQIPISTSDSRDDLEALRDRREVEREDWLASHSIPWFQQCDVIYKEEIVEVQTV
jgi:hypothetical protein